MGGPEESPGAPSPAASARDAEPGSTPELPEPPPDRPRRTGLLLVAAATVLVVAGAGAAIAYFLLRGGDSAIDELVPSSAHVYLTAHLDPAAGQKVGCCS